MIPNLRPHDSVPMIPDDVFPEWHASATAELFTPSVFRNEQKSGGYWF